MKTIAKFSNFLFRYTFPLYKILYFIYKRITDFEMISLMRNNIDKGTVILDIGANIGFYSLFFSKCTGANGLVIAFEPEKENFSRLTKLTKDKKNIQLVNCAVSNNDLEIDLYLSSDLNVDHHTYDDGQSRKSVKVKSVSIDSFLKLNFPDVIIDFIKIDIQGFDYFALKGMIDTINRSRKLTIFGEFWPYGLLMTKVDPEEYYRELINSGFLMFSIPGCDLRSRSACVTSM